MDPSEIVAYARANLEPLGTPEVRAYLGAAVLRDGLRLPCVLLESVEAHTELALRRFEETRRRKEEHARVVRSFVTSRSTVAPWDVARVEPSPYAMPAARMLEIKGETSMGWTQFTATMRDGRTFAFGTPWARYFFDMPEGCVATDIVKITPAAPMAPRDANALRDRPYFTCFVEGL
jgi:hypothetical protein